VDANSCFHTLRRIVMVLLVIAACHLLVGAGLIKAKAWLAPHLIAHAWQRTLDAGSAGERPWPWADTWPVARLFLPVRGIEQFVLAGDSGNALAFGPGHATASAAPGAIGTVVIGGHRDTHFAFLRDVAVGEFVRLELPDGQHRVFRIARTRIVDADQESLARNSAGHALLLVTCYPFDAVLPGGPLRYVVTAEPVQEASPG